MTDQQPSNLIVRYKLRNVIGEPHELKLAELFHRFEEVDW